MAANQGPTIAVPASAALDPSGKFATLSVLGADDGGESNLTYAWAVSSSPTGSPTVIFSAPTGQTYNNGTNGASTMVATFGAAGTYTFTVAIADQGGLTVKNNSSPLTVNVTQVATTIAISPAPATAQAGGPTRTFVATAADQFTNVMSPEPTFSWSVTAGQIDNTGVFTPPAISEPCQVTVAGGGASFTEAVTITASSPQTAGRLGDDWIEPLFEQALGSPLAESSTAGDQSSISARQAHLDQLLGGPGGVTVASLSDWTPGLGNPFPAYVPGQTGNSTTITPTFTFTTSWPVGGTTWTTSETAWSSDTLQTTYASGSGAWTYDETQTWNYTINGAPSASGGATPTTASGSLSYVLDAWGGNGWSQYDFSVTASATAGGTCAGGAWTQTTTNSDSIDEPASGAGSAWGSGKTTSSYSYSQPYSGGTSSQPVTGSQAQTCNDHVSYSYSTLTSSGTLESSGSFNTSYTGSGRGSVAPSGSWSENENGGTGGGYDYRDYFAYSGSGWSMSSASGTATGNTYQSQFSSGPYSSGSASGSGSGTMTGTSTQSSSASTSYSYQEQANWSSAAGWTVTGTQTASQSGTSNSYYNASGNYTIPYSAGSGSGSSASGASGSSGTGSTGGNSPFSFSGGAIQYSGAGTQNQSGSDYSSYSSTGNYTLASDGSWQGSSGSGWSSGNGFTSSSYGGGGSYSYQLPSPSGGGAGGGGGGAGTVSGTFQESGSNGSTYSYHTDSTLSGSGWSQSGWQSTTSFSQSYQDASGSGSFNLPTNAQGFSYSGTAYEDNGQSSYSQQSASYTLDSSGNWQQSSGTGNNTGHTWQSSSQSSGTYSHVVNGVTLQGSFSQSASVDDTSSYTTGGYAGSSGWVPTGSGSDEIVTSSSNSFSGSGSSVGILPASGSVGILPASGWISSGTQSESQSARASASHTTYYSLQLPSTSGGGAGGGGGASWQATSGSGSTSGNGTTFAGYSGSSRYNSYSGNSGSTSGGSIQGSFTQGQSNTTSYNFNTNDSFQPPSSSGGGGFWQATSGSGSTVDSGASSFSYSGSGSYGGVASGPNGTMSQSGGANESFNYSKNYSIDGNGNWQVASGNCSGGASGSGSTFASYAANPTPYSMHLPSAVVDSSGNAIGVSGTDQQSGSNNTSYSFQTTATYNGIDWSETGSKSSSASGDTTDSYSAQSGNLSFPTFGASGTGSARASGATTNSYSYTEHTFLDDNGAWQNGSGSGSVTASGSQGWSYSGSGPFQTTVFGETDSGTATASGSQTDSYQYSEYYNFCPDGAWQAASGSGSASGSQSIGSGYAVSGGYSSGGNWSGTTSASANNSTGYTYLTNSTFDPNGVTGTANGWSTTGSASASSTGFSNSSFSASSLSPCQMTVYGSADSGTYGASGNQRDSYQYTKYYDLTPGGSWQVTGGNGSASGSQTVSSGYAVSGGYSTMDRNSPVSALNWSDPAPGGWSGTTAASANAATGYGYSTNSTYSAATGDWSTTGSASATTTGSTGSSFSATAPYSSTGGNESISGTASGSGGDESSYSYTETADLQPSGSWSAPTSGTGWASGSSNVSFSVADSNDILQLSGGGGSATGRESEGVGFSMDYNTSATLASDGSGWVQSGSGSVSANMTDDYSYGGSGSYSPVGTGTGSGTEGQTINPITSSGSCDWNASGSGSATNSYSDALTLANGSAWTHQQSLSTSTRQEQVYGFSGSYSYQDAQSGGGNSWSANIGDDQITTTQGGSAPTFSGSGSASGTVSSYTSGGSQWSQTDTDSSWSPANAGAGVSESVSQTYTGNPAPDPSSYNPPPAPYSSVSNYWLTGLYSDGTHERGKPNGLTNYTFTSAQTGALPTPVVPDVVSSVTFGAPTLPGSVGSPGTPTPPVGTSITSAASSTGSLAGFVTWPGLVDAVWGMGFTPQTAPQTPFALGNVSGAVSTSETMRGADAVFGGDNVAPVFPVTRSSLVVNYGFNGVSAGNPAAGGGVSGGVATLAAVAQPLATAAAQPNNGSSAATNPMTNTVVPVNSASPYDAHIEQQKAKMREIASQQADVTAKIRVLEQKYQALRNQLRAALQAPVRVVGAGNVSANGSVDILAEMRKIRYQLKSCYKLSQSLQQQYGDALMTAIHYAVQDRKASGEWYQDPVHNPSLTERFVGGVFVGTYGLVVGGAVIGLVGLASPVAAGVLVFVGSVGFGESIYEAATGNEVNHWTGAPTGRTLSVGDRVELAGELTPGGLAIMAGILRWGYARLMGSAPPEAPGPGRVPAQVPPEVASETPGNFRPQLPGRVSANEVLQRELLSNSQARIRAAIEAAPPGGKAAAKGRILNELGHDFQDLSTNTLKQIPGAEVEKNVSIGTGPGSELDNQVSLNGKTVLVESKYSIGDVNERTVNQISNAVKTNGSVILNVARKPTATELAKLKTKLGDAVFSKVKVVSSQTELYEAAISALQ